FWKKISSGRGKGFVTCKLLPPGLKLAFKARRDGESRGSPFGKLIEAHNMPVVKIKRKLCAHIEISREVWRASHLIPISFLRFFQCLAFVNFPEIAQCPG